MASKRKWNNPSCTRTYNSWRSMRNRVLYNSCASHDFYKDKGISICDRWINSYDNFFEDMGERPPKTSLDRINPNGNYEPSNCRWASDRVQQNNKLSLTKVEKDGVIKSIGDWCFELGFSEKQMAKVYKRHSNYGASTYEELFCGNLYSFRKSREERCCIVCSRTESIKWRSKACNNCYAKALRYFKSKNMKVNMAEYSQLVVDSINSIG